MLLRRPDKAFDREVGEAMKGCLIAQAGHQIDQAAVFQVAEQKQVELAISFQETRQLASLRVLHGLLRPTS